MKKTFIKSIAAVLLLVFTVCFASCSEETPADIWANAAYTENAEFGEGSKTVTVEVQAGDNSVVFTIHTDKDTVGAALLEHGLIAGEDGPYGLYVKTVNGILADFDIDQSYWSFCIDGTTAMTGVDTTKIEEKQTYQLVYTK